MRKGKACRAKDDLLLLHSASFQRKLGDLSAEGAGQAFSGIEVIGIEEIGGDVMRLSARNTLPGVIRKIEQGAVNAEVTLELAPGIIVISIITLDAVNSLRLKAGDQAYAVIKASSVMIGTD